MVCGQEGFLLCVGWESLVQRVMCLCEGVVVPEGGREGTQGYRLRLETAPVLLYSFLIIGVEL